MSRFVPSPAEAGLAPSAMRRPGATGRVAQSDTAHTLRHSCWYIQKGCGCGLQSIRYLIWGTTNTSTRLLHAERPPWFGRLWHTGWRLQTVGGGRTEAPGLRRHHRRWPADAAACPHRSERLDGGQDIL